MRTTHQPQPVRVLIADNQAMSPHRIQEMIVSNFEIVGTLPDDAERTLSQALRLKPDIVLINISALRDWSELVKRIIEKLPRTRIVLYQKDREATEIDQSAFSRGLSNRQYEVLALLAAGHAMKEIAYRLGIAYRTVAFHKYHMMEKLGITTTAGLMKYALNRNIREGFASVTDPDLLATGGRGSTPFEAGQSMQGQPRVREAGVETHLSRAL